MLDSLLATLPDWYINLLSVPEIYCFSSDRSSGEETLLERLLNSDLSSPMACVHALQVARDEGSVRVLPLLCRHLVTHPFSSISAPAASLTRRILASQTLMSQCSVTLFAMFY